MRNVHVLLAAACCACASTVELGPAENLAASAFAADFVEFPMRRVAVLPPRGIEGDDARDLQKQFAAEIASRAPFEVVTLAPADLVDLPGITHPGQVLTRPEAIVALSKRHDLDAFYALEVSDRTTFAPLHLTLEADLVGADTGARLWTAQGAWNAADQRVRRSLECWFAAQRGAAASDEDWSLYLLAPRRFAAYGCAQLAERFFPPPPPPSPPPPVESAVSDSWQR